MLELFPLAAQPFPLTAYHINPIFVKKEYLVIIMG